jgi:ubiquinone/menaquinone biosynthesis C-methylase UbiE
MMGKANAPGAQEIKSRTITTQEDVHRFWVESTQDFYEKRKTGIDISQRQDNYWRYLDRWEKRIILRYAPDGLIFDLGAGTGRISNYLRAAGRKVIAADFVFECLKEVEGNATGSVAANMNVTKIAIKDRSVDCVVSCRVLQSLPTIEEKEAAISEVARVLHDRGRLILTEGNPLRDKFVPVPYNFYISLGSWLRILDRHGFSIYRVHGIPFLSLAKAIDRLSRSALDRIKWPYVLASAADRCAGRSPLKHMSLQYDIIADKAE